MPNLKLPTLKLRLATKFAIFLIVISALPLILANLLWFIITRNEILSANTLEVKRTAQVTARQVDDFLTTKLISLIIHSQTDAVLAVDTDKIKLEFQNFLLQDQDIQQLQLLDRSGKETAHLTRTKIYPVQELTDQSANNAFKITTFVGGTRYFSPVYFGGDSRPVIDIAIPIVKPQGQQSLQNLRTSALGELRQQGDIFGVITETIDLSQLWHSLADVKVGKTGYVYLVDQAGFLLTHPNQNFKIGQGLRRVAEVERFVSSTRVGVGQNPISDKEVARSANEQDQTSLTYSYPVRLTNWGVISEVPLADSLAAANQVAVFALILFLLILGFVVLLSLLVSSQIVAPIEELQQGAKLFGTRNLAHRLEIKTGDEIEELGASFNTMASGLQQAFQNLEKDKNVISSERNKLAIVLSGISDAVVAVDLERKIIIFNKAAEEMIGITETDALGKPIDDLIRLFDNKDELVPSEFCPTKPTGSEEIVFWRQNLKLVGVGKREAFVNLIAGQIREGAAINLGCILTFHDVGREKQLEAMKIDFVSIAVHELRTPLTSVRGYLDVFLTENKGKFTADQNMFLSRINIAAKQLSALVDNLLSVARIERGQLSINIESVDWAALIKQVVAEFVDRAQDKKVKLKFTEPEKPLPNIEADKLRMIEVLSNLLANAVAYNKVGGKVRLWTEQKVDLIVTHVQDTGQGIPAEAIPHLFTKFFRVSGKLEQGSKGTGLGLYIAKAITQAHHGKIWVESKPGQGSTFSFSLPVVQPKKAKKGIKKLEGIIGVKNGR